MDIDDGEVNEGGTTQQFQSFFTEADQVMQLIEGYAVLTEVHQLKKQTQQLQKIVWLCMMILYALIYSQQANNTCCMISW